MAVVNLQAVVTEVGSIRGFLYGSESACAYDNWVSHLAEGRVSYYNVYAPWEEQNNDFGDFYIADSNELQNWGLVIDDFLDLELLEAQNKLDQFGFPFQVVQFQDLDSGRNLYMIRELLNDDVDDNGTAMTDDDETGSFDYGWGLYIYDPSASRPIIVTAPHPCDDFPSPPFALEAFLKLDARFLMINGAGREVAYHYPYNSNNQSISDPSRFEDHPFNVAYQRCCDQIRGISGKTEFSLQIHSYDWNKYSGQPNVMLSAGNGRVFPALPIRDFSRARHDIIHHTPWLIHPQNTIGTHSEVEITDFYSVYYDLAEPVCYQDDDHNVQLGLNHDLPGAVLNRQMLYTAQDNLFDVYSPFLHVEMDELAKCYIRNEANLHWFYGYDAAEESWGLSERYTRFIEFYTPWLDALYEVVDSMLILDDGTGPSNPENLHLTDFDNGYIEFAWERCYSYDFDSYEIVLRWLESDAWAHRILDRNSDPELAWQNLDSFSLDLGDQDHVYYLRIRARDKHGNLSPFSNEVKIWNLDNCIADFTALERDGCVDLAFFSPLGGIQGFNIYRGKANNGYSRVSSWQNNPGLQPNAIGEYFYSDQSALNGVVYEYQVSAEYADGFEYFHWEIPRVCPFREYGLVLENVQHGLADSLSIGVSKLARDDEDGYDQMESTAPDALEIGTCLVDGEYTFHRDIRANFDPETHCKTWDIQYHSGFGNVCLVLTPDPQLIMDGAELLLYDVESDFWHDLRLGPYVWVVETPGWRNLQLHWGRQSPLAQFPYAPDVFQWLGEPLDLSWQVINIPRVESIDLCLQSTDNDLWILTGLPPQMTDLQFTPAEAISGARLKTVLHCQNGSELPFYSARHYNVIPQNMLYEQPAGFSLLSFPLSGFEQNVTELLGNAATAFSFDLNSDWQQETVITSGNAYLVHHPQAYQISLPAELPDAPFPMYIHPGWNLIPNPHYHHYELRNLCFDDGQGLRTYAEMHADSLVLPRIYIYGRDGFKPSELIPPKNSFLLKYMGNQITTLIMDPCFHTEEELDWDTLWSVQLSVSNGYLSGDSVSLGSADQSSEGFDPMFDLPKPPGFPSAPYNLSLLLADPDTGDVHELQSEYRGLYPDYNETAKTWQFRLEIDQIQPLRFKLESSELPSNYSFELIFGNQHYFLEDGQQLWFDPPHTGELIGSARIHSYTPENRIISPATEIRIYPNPFKDHISFDLAALKGREAAIAVYNLRGQKVRSLHEGKIRENGSILHWNGKDENGAGVAPGIYLLRVSSGGKSLLQRICKY